MRNTFNTSFVDHKPPTQWRYQWSSRLNRFERRPFKPVPAGPSGFRGIWLRLTRNDRRE